MLQIHTTFCVYPGSFVHLAVPPFFGAVLSHETCVQCLASSVEVGPPLCFLLEGPQQKLSRRL